MRIQSAIFFFNCHSIEKCGTGGISFVHFRELNNQEKSGLSLFQVQCLKKKKERKMGFELLIKVGEDGNMEGESER